MKKIVLTGGGTGGHIIPNLAIIPILKKHFKIYYLGEKNSLEEKLISADKDITFVPINAVKFVRKINLKNLLIPYKFYKYTNQVKKILQKIKPNIIFSKGGYVSLPVVFAGSKLKIPILSHESDLTMGLANKLILKKAKIMFTSFRETCVNDKCIFSGSPIRKEILNGNAENIKENCNFKKNNPVILFFGGSKGSKIINSFVLNNIDALEKYNIIHFVGQGNKTSYQNNNYFQIEFSENISDYFAYADIVICRAGANSIFELLAIQKPMILIPLSKKISRGDQIQNAKSFKKQGFAEVIEEENLTTHNILILINKILENKNLYIKNMQQANLQNANKIITDYILQYCEK